MPCSRTTQQARIAPIISILLFCFAFRSRSPTLVNIDDTHDLFLDVTPVFPSGRGRRLELVIEQLKEGVPHLDDSTRHGGDVPLPRIE